MNMQELDNLASEYQELEILVNKLTKDPKTKSKFSLWKMNWTILNIKDILEMHPLPWRKILDFIHIYPLHTLF